MVLQFNSPSLRFLRPSYSPPPPPYPLEWDLHLPSFEVDVGLGARAQASTVGLTFGLGWGAILERGILCLSPTHREEGGNA